jgi:hypothetical protein
MRAPAARNRIHSPPVRRGHVEPAGRLEGVAADRAETCPERARLAGRLLVDVVVQEVAEARDRAGRLGVVVVGPEDGGQFGIAVEMRADALEGAGVDNDVGVDEDEDLAACAACALVARVCGPGPRRAAHHHQLLWRPPRRLDRREAAAERGRRVGRRHDRREAGHDSCRATAGARR